MTPPGPSERFDDLARRLARPREPIFSATAGGAPGAGAAIDRLARSLGAPVTRRRAVGLIGGAAVAASLLRPGAARAQNCYPGGPQICRAPNGQRVCVPDDYHCCSNDRCAIACYPWQECESPGNCSDTPRLCTDPRAEGGDPDRVRFCAKRTHDNTTCFPDTPDSELAGWCCLRHEECGTEIGDCVCPSSRRCGTDCCRLGYECVSLGFGRGKACMPECPDGWHRDGFDCVCDHGETCGPFCCGRGKVCDGRFCVEPKKSKLKELWDSFTGAADAGAQSAAAGARHAGAQRATAAQAGDPVATALTALAAVNAQGVVAGRAFADERVDRAHRRRVRSPRLSPLRIAAGPGLDAASARALERMLAAEAKGFALSLACATAVARARGALARHDKRAARRQMLSAARFAADAARALRRVPRLRADAVAALQAAGTTEVVATGAEVLALQAEVRAGGLPAELRTALGRLGVRGADLKRVRAALVASATGGPALIGPLADPARTRTLRSIASELARYSRAIRRTPITRSRGGPRRFRLDGD